MHIYIFIRVLMCEFVLKIILNIFLYIYMYVYMFIQNRFFLVRTHAVP